MSFPRAFVVFCLAVGYCFSAQVIAGGYSDVENHEIWELRQAANQYAAQAAIKKCAWKPKSPTVPADQIPSDLHVSKPRLFHKLMAMLRLDQNARVIRGALDNDESRARLLEVDADNLPILKDITSTYGFPTVEEVGKVGANAMLLLVAHADKNLAFQKSTLRIMEDEVAKGRLSAMYPSVLKAIRPGLVEPSGPSAKRSSDDNEPSNNEKISKDGEPSKDGHADMVPGAFSTGRECYNSNYRKIFNSYIRSRYKESVGNI